MLKKFIKIKQNKIEFNPFLHTQRNKNNTKNYVFLIALLYFSNPIAEKTKIT